MKYLLLFLGLALAFLAWRVTALGLFNQSPISENSSQQNILRMGGIPFPEDMVLLEEGGAAKLLVSSCKRNAAGRPMARGHLYVVENLQVADPEKRRLSLKGLKGEFHPQGLDAIYEDGSWWLHVVNDRLRENPSVEIFEKAGKEWTHAATLTDPGLHSPNNLASLSKESVLLTDDSRYGNRITRSIAVFLGFNRGAVWHLNANEENHQIDGSFKFPNGIAVSDGNLFIADTLQGTIERRTANPGGEWLAATTYGVGVGVDNLSVDDRGDIWFTRHPNLLRLARFRENPDSASPTLAGRIRWQSQQGAEWIFADSGERFSAGSVAINHGGYLWFGSVGGDRIMRVPVRPR